LRLLPCYVSFRWFLEMRAERQTVVRAEIVKINTENPEPSLIHYAAEQIRAGQVLGMPTDTFYGLAADPLNLRAVDRVYEIKSRSRHKPLSLLIESTDQAEDLAKPLPDEFYKLAKRFWPGPLTVIVRAAGFVAYTCVVTETLPSVAGFFVQVTVIVTGCEVGAFAAQTSPK